MVNDEEYQRYKEEQNNTLKMGMILKSLNAPFRRAKKNATMSTAQATKSSRAEHTTASLSQTGTNVLNTKTGVTSNQDLHHVKVE